MGEETRGEEVPLLLAAAEAEWLLVSLSAQGQETKTVNSQVSDVAESAARTRCVGLWSQFFS